MAKRDSNTHVKVCTKCGEALPATLVYFYSDVRGRFGLRATCINCFRQTASHNSSRRYQNNRESAHQYARQLYKKHPDRAKTRVHKRRALLKKASGIFTASDVRLLLASQNGLCWWCSAPVGDKYHVDHRIPVSRGGTNSPENLCISCAECNLKKGAKLPQEWNGRLL